MTPNAGGYVASGNPETATFAWLFIPRSPCKPVGEILHWSLLLGQLEDSPLWETHLAPFLEPSPKMFVVDNDMAEWLMKTMGSRQFFFCVKTINAAMHQNII